MISFASIQLPPPPPPPRHHHSTLVSAHLHKTTMYQPDRFRFFPTCHPFHQMLDQSTGFFLSFSSFTVSLHFSGLIFLLPRIMISAEVLWPLLLLWKQYFSTLMEHCVIQILSIFMPFETCFKKLVVFLLLIYNILVHVFCKKKKKIVADLLETGPLVSDSLTTDRFQWRDSHH